MIMMVLYEVILINQRNNQQRLKWRKPRSKSFIISIRLEHSRASAAAFTTLSRLSFSIMPDTELTRAHRSIYYSIRADNKMTVMPPLSPGNWMAAKAFNAYYQISPINACNIWMLIIFLRHVIAGGIHLHALAICHIGRLILHDHSHDWWKSAHASIDNDDHLTVIPLLPFNAA